MGLQSRPSRKGLRVGRVLLLQRRKAHYSSIGAYQFPFLLYVSSQDAGQNYQNSLKETDFLWAHESTEKGIHLINWKKVFNHKNGA